MISGDIWKSLWPALIKMDNCLLNTPQNSTSTRMAAAIGSSALPIQPPPPGATQGVQAWKDTDGDVGGVVPMLADTKPEGGDGYETLVFDQGKGNLTDGAWVRISPNDPKTVQIAFKLSMLGSPSSFAMGAWAGANIDPSMFDYNDHMTHAQAGDPNQSYPQVYPIKALAEIDNTCRLAIGFVPKGNVPGLCKIFVPGRPNAPIPPVPTGGPKCPPSQCG